VAKILGTFLTIYRRHALGPVKTGSVILETAIKILRPICKHVCHKFYVKLSLVTKFHQLKGLCIYLLTICIIWCTNFA